MKLFKSLPSVAALLALSYLATPAVANTITYTAIGTGVDGSVNGSATITTGTNTLTVVLSSLINNPTADGQELSGVFISLSNPVGSPTISSATGQLIDISSSGGIPVGGSLNHWGTSSSGSTVCLETVGTCAVGGKPVDLIIGTGPYTNANPSITGRNPQIQGTGTFVLDLSGVTSGTTVTGVTFEFGTGPQSFDGTPTTPGTPPPAVPEPSSLILFGTGVLSTASMVYRRMRSI